MPTPVADADPKAPRSHFLRNTLSDMTRARFTLSSRASRPVLAAALASIGLFAAGCSQTGEMPEAVMTTVDKPAAQETDAVTETVTAEEKTTVAAPTKPTASSNCASLPKDPRSMYPSGTAPGRMPSATGSDTNYWIEDIDNYYDPCAPVSWVIFRGMRGDINGPAGTGASVSDGIAFYLNGEPDGDMRTFRRITGVSLSGDTVSFSWGERPQDLSGSVKEYNSATLSFSGGRIQAVGGDVAAFNTYWNGSDRYMLGHYG